MLEEKLTRIKKIKLLIWKNYCVVWNNKLEFFTSILVPIAFALVLVGFRLSVDVEHVPAITYKHVSVTTSFNKLINLLKVRKAILVNKDPGFTHSVIVPQLIVAHAPDIDPQLNNLITEASKDWTSVKLVSFKNCDELRTQMAKEHFLAGICFDNADFKDASTQTKINGLPTNLNLRFIYPGELRDFDHSIIADKWSTYSSWNHRRTMKKLFTPNIDGNSAYLREGFMMLQRSISAAYISKITKRENIPQFHLRKFPHIAYHQDSLVEQYHVTLTNILLFGFIVPSVIFTNNIVREKELALRSYLKLINISITQQLIAWLVVGVLLQLFSTIIILLLLKIGWNEGFGLMSKSNVFCLLVFFTTYCFTNTCFCILVSAICCNSKHATPTFVLLWFLQYSFFLVESTNYMFAHATPVHFIYFYNANMAEMIDWILQMDVFANGLQWKELILDQSRIRRNLIALQLNGIVFFVLALILDGFNPGKYGKRIKLSSWLTLCRRNGANKLHPMKFSMEKINVSPDDMSFGVETAYTYSAGPSSNAGSASNPGSYTYKMESPSESFEVKSKMRQLTIQITELTKKYGDRVVVNEAVLNIFNGEIMVLMGPNGSGKSVLAAMIAGFVRPTSGSMTVNDIDVIKNRKDVADEMGLAFGTSLLLDNLTFSQQMKFHARLKGMLPESAHDELLYLCGAMHLDDFRYTMTRHLSNGIKHQLAILCALAGKSSVVILDDVDAAMDDSVRRIMVDLLNNEKENRTILLTTNSHSIAEIIANRVSMLSKGKLMCSGSPNFLKKSYGRNYYLVCYKSDICDTEAVTNFIQIFFTGITDVQDEFSHVTYILPNSEGDKIIELMKEIENRITELGLTSVAIRETSVKDIFMITSKINPNFVELTRETSRILKQYVDDDHNNLSFLRDYVPLTGCQLVWNKVIGVLWKCYVFNKRHYKLLALQIFLPSAIVIFEVIVFTTMLRSKTVVSRKYDLSPTQNTLTIVSNANKLDPLLANFLMYYRQYIFHAGEQHSVVFTFGEPMTDFVMEFGDERFREILNILFFGLTISKRKIWSWFNVLHLHSAPLSMNVVQNSILRGLLNTTHARITVVLDPLPCVSDLAAANAHNKNQIYEFCTFCLTLCNIFINFFILTRITKERDSHGQLMQHFLGLRGFPFWVGYVTVFILRLAISFPLALFFLYIVNDIFNDGKVDVFMLVSAVLILCHLYQMLFVNIVNIIFPELDSKYFAYLHLTVIGIIVTLGLLDYHRTQPGGDDTNFYLFFLPFYIVHKVTFSALYSSARRYMCRNEIVYQVSKHLLNCKTEPNCCFDDNLWIINKRNINGLLVIILILILLVLCIENSYSIVSYLNLCINSKIITKYTRKRKTAVEKEQEEEQITSVNEGKKIYEINTEDYKDLPLVCQDVSKKLGKAKIINNLNLIVRPHQIFSMLGTSSSGKSTLVSLITGDLSPTSGRLFVFGQNSMKKTKQYRDNIGYCPQNSRGQDYYTIREKLEIIALLRGIPRKKVKKMCASLAVLMGLQEDYDKYLDICSKGIQRCVDVALAMIGSPNLLVFDGLSDVLDPANKLLVYKTLSGLRLAGATIVISTLSVDDCQILSDRLGILLHGQFRVLGTPREIHNSHGKGYLLRLKLTPFVRVYRSHRMNVEQSANKISSKAYVKLTAFVESRFTNAVIKGEPGDFVLFLIPSQSATIADIFECMRKYMEKLHAEEFSISRNTLGFVYEELVFMNQFQYYKNRRRESQH